MITSLSSLLFGIASLYTTRSWMQLPFMGLMAFSVLHHRNIELGYFNVTVDCIDRLISHYIGSRSFYDAVMCKNATSYTGVLAYYYLLAYVLFVYYVKKSYRLPSPYWQRWHITIHIASSLGCCLLYTTPCVSRLEC
jgi:hypothetical protein